MASPAFSFCAAVENSVTAILNLVIAILLLIEKLTE